MEANKRVLLAKNMWKEEDDNPKLEIYAGKQEDFNSNVREKDPLAFFDPDYLNKLRGKGLKTMHSEAQQFSHRLDHVLVDPLAYNPKGKLPNCNSNKSITLNNSSTKTVRLNTLGDHRSLSTL